MTAEHGLRLFINAEMPPEDRYRAECLCGWGDPDRDPGPRFYATERNAKIAQSQHTRRSP